MSTHTPRRRGGVRSRFALSINGELRTVVASVAGAGRRWRLVAACCTMLVVAAVANAQEPAVTWRGFVEARTTAYPQEAPDDAQRLIGEGLFRVETSARVARWLRLAGALDARTDTHHEVARVWRLDWSDRTPLRPALSVRQAQATVMRGAVTVDVGKQFIRWGKADVLNPTDRFAPRDFLTVVDNDFLAVSGVHATVGGQSDSVEAVWLPHFTPSRIPVATHRWARLPETINGLPVIEHQPVFPARSQAGVRWNHLGEGYEFSISAYDGYNHLPLFAAALAGAPPRSSGFASMPARTDLVPSSVPLIALTPFYPRIRMIGGDAAVPIRWFTVKGEIGYFTAPHHDADEYALYVIQLERLAGEWSFVGGYAGEAVRVLRSTTEFAPDRGFAKSFLGRAGYTIDANRSVVFEWAVRQNGNGSWLRAEYSQATGRHWRTTAGLTWIRGNDTDFLGQYHFNSHATLAARYSF